MGKISEENTVKYYDIIYKDWISKSYTDWEINFFKKYLKSSSKVLDIGCGSGRHLVPLYEMGFDLTGIEPLSNFVKQIKEKNPNIKVIHSSLDDAVIPGEFDLIISMWNAFHQLAYNYGEGLEVFNKLKKHLTDDGNIILSLSPLEEWDIKDYTFDHTVIENNIKYYLTWNVDTFDEIENIVVSIENIKVYNQSNELIDERTAKVKQKYWSEKELKSLCNEVGLKYTKYQAQEGFYDNYYVFSIK